MRTPLCDLYEIEAPIFAFSHSPAVIAAVSKAGGFGVLGAAGMEAEQLDQALQMLSRECAGKSFGVDLIIPEQYVGHEEGGLPLAALLSRIPQQYRDFLDRLLDNYQVSRVPVPATLAERANFSQKRGRQLVDIALAYPIKLIVNALGVPPASIIEQAHRQGVRVGALVGAVKHAIHQRAAGVDLIVAQGYEAGGHTGEIATMVLTPQVVDAVAPLPVVTAGGIASGRQMAAALALGAQGVWTGSIWLMTAEAETHPVVKEKFARATSSDTLRSRASTGKPARQLRSAWTDAWEDQAAPAPLPMPLQGVLTLDAQRSIQQDARQGGEGGKQLINYFVGQAVGMLDQVRPAAEVYQAMVYECEQTLKRLA
jgi:NAD(P)H-dependent flavin oxidoreductase YrpB (nitropropane dioxygenase family)